MRVRALLVSLMALVLWVPAYPAAAAKPATALRIETAILAGGCFWCVEADFEKLDGVLDAVSGYTGGQLADPTYEQVSAGGTGHIEAVKVTYDADTISYSEILDYFWRHIDPTRDDGQFCDQGPQYRPAIFYGDENQRQAALASREKIQQSKPFPDPLKVELRPAGEFYRAEGYHQDYYKAKPLRYRFYRLTCGRDARLDTLWRNMNE